MGLLDELAGSYDPATADPQTGLVEAQRRQLAASSLGNIGGILLAAGAEQMPSERASKLAQLGNVPQNTQAIASSMSQQNLEAQRTQLYRQQNAQRQELLKYIAMPEFQQQFEGMPKQVKALAMAQIHAGDVAGMVKTVQESRQQTQPINLGGGHVGIRQADGGVLVINPDTQIQMRFGPDGQPVGGAAYGGSQTIEQGDMNINPETGTRDAWLAKQNRPPGYADLLSRVARGDLDPRTISMRDPMRTLLLRDIATFAPDWTEQAYNNKKRMQESVTPGGKLYQTTILPAQRFLNHSGALPENVEKLDLMDNYFGTMGGNTLKLLEMKKRGGEATQLVVKAEENLRTAKDEFAKFLRGTNQMTDDAQRRIDRIQLSDGPSAIKGFLSWAMEAMRGQVEPLHADYQRHMRNPRAGLNDMLGSGVEQSIGRVNAWTSGQPAAAPQSGSPAPIAGQPQQALQPQQGAAMPPVNLLKEGHITTFGNGQKWLLRNGQPVQVP